MAAAPNDPTPIAGPATPIYGEWSSDAAAKERARQAPWRILGVLLIGAGLYYFAKRKRHA